MYGFVNSLFKWIYSRAAEAPATTEGATTTFGFAPIAMAVFLGALIVSMCLIGYGLITTDWFWAALGGAMFILGICGWPAALEADATELRCAQMFCKKKHIPWSEVASAKFNTANSQTTVAATGGTKIIHTGFHCSPSTFHELIRKFSTCRIEYTEPTWTGHRTISRR